MNKDTLKAFRDGVKWGFTLMSHWTPGNVMMIGRGENEKPLDQVLAEVDAGRWDTSDYKEGTDTRGFFSFLIGAPPTYCECGLPWGHTTKHAPLSANIRADHAGE